MERGRESRRERGRRYKMEGRRGRLKRTRDNIHLDGQGERQKKL